MLKTLVKKQLMEIFRSYFYDAKKNRKRSALSTAMFIALFVLLMVGMLGGIFTFLSFTMCGAMTSVGMDWLYFTLMGLMAIFLGAFGSVFNTYSSLYIAKDNDFLLSMPIPVKIIMGSRLMSVYLMGLMYAAVIFVPAMIVYWIVAPVTVSAVVCSIIALLMISIFVMVLSCALGWLVAKISLKLKNKSIITVIVSLVLFAVYYFFCFRASYMLQAMLANLGEVGAGIMSAAYPLYMFGRAASGSWVDTLIVSAVVLALFALTWVLLSRSFLKIATSTGGTAKVIYREKAAKLHSAPRALLGKELARFGSSPNYMLNCGLGLFIMPIAAVLLLIKGADISALLMDVFNSADISAVLLAGVYARGTTTLNEPAPSRNHTELMLPEFGVPTTAADRTASVTGPRVLQAAEVRVPGDPSSAAFLVCAAAGAFVVVRGCLLGSRCNLARYNRRSLGGMSEEQIAAEQAARAQAQAAAQEAAAQAAPEAEAEAQDEKETAAPAEAPAEETAENGADE